jgi:hypothetical protein
MLSDESRSVRGEEITGNFAIAYKRGVPFDCAQGRLSTPFGCASLRSG